MGNSVLRPARFANLACHLGEGLGFEMPGFEWLDDGDETAAPGDKSALPCLFDLAHDAGRLAEKILHRVDESFIAIRRRWRILHSKWRHAYTPASLKLSCAKNYTCRS
jgi:hypothetical protein